MGFFDLECASYHDRPDRIEGISVELLHKAGCAACPLNHQRDLQHPNMQPYGTEEPVVYMLGEAPGAEEDARGRPFVGKSGTVLRMRIPREWFDKLRWNNCVRTRPPGNRTPGFAEIEACRMSVQGDIEATKPRAIFGFGNIPLEWAVNETGITKWRGRWLPVTIGAHSCWYFPIVHPAAILRERKFTPRGPNEYGHDDEFAFAMDLRNAFARVEHLPEPIVHSKQDALADVEWVTGHGPDDLTTVIDFLHRASDQDVVGIDYETKRLRPYYDDARLLTAAVSRDGHTLAFPFEHPQAGWSGSQLKTLRAEFRTFLLEGRCHKVAHNLAFELEWSGFEFGAPTVRGGGGWGDTMSQAFILDERMKLSKPDALSLEFLGVQYFGINLKKLFTGLDKDHLDRESLDVVLQYNGVDAKYHRLLFLEQERRVEEEGLQDVYYYHIRRVPTMVLTQLKGVPIDFQVTIDFKQRHEEQLQDIEARIAQTPLAMKFKNLTNTTLRPSAKKDVGWVLQQVGIAGDTTDKKVLAQIKNPIGPLLLEWRAVYKVYSTYVKPVHTYIMPDGRVHPIISTCQTRTWRSSSEDPNVQNWPKRNEAQREVRKQIRDKRPGYKIVSFDYGSIQARNIAMESQDAALVKAFWDHYDIHQDWAERVVRLYPGWIKEGVKQFANDKKLARKYRDRAKNEFVFPSFFGAIPNSVAGYLGVPPDIGQKLQDHLWEMFPDIHAWQERVRQSYFKLGYVTGLSGFRRHAPVKQTELINAPIQGDEALIVCEAMATLSERDPDLLQAIMEIHDDLTFCWHESMIEQLSEIVIDTMLHPPFEWTRVVPIVVERAIGDDWFNQSKAGEFSSDTW